MGLPVDVLGLSREPWSEIRRYARQSSPAFPVAAFPSDRMAELYGALAVPMTVVLDPEGRIAFGRLGALTSPATVDSVISAVREAARPKPNAGSGAGDTSAEQ